MSDSAVRGVGGSDREKRAAGLAALSEVTSGMTLGLGTGSTVRYFLEGLAEALESGKLSNIRGVPTSIDTERRCQGLGISTIELAEQTLLDLAVDGADEVSPELDLIKGLGGALLREKIVVQAARRFVVIVDSGKEVPGLGHRAPLPVEVIPFGWPAHLAFFRSLGADPRPRRDDSGKLLVTDNGNHLVDLRFANGIDSPRKLQSELRGRAGIVETGLFLDLADRAFVGTKDRVIMRERNAA